jgi:hypothetical protein
MIRLAEPQDVDAIVGLVRDLATYERAADEVELTTERLQAVLFGASPAVFCHVAEVEGAVVGIAIWFVSFSTWLGVHGLYLEDRSSSRSIAAAASAARSFRRSRASPSTAVTAGWSGLFWTGTRRP